MATQPIERPASAAPVPRAAISRVLSRFDRGQLAGFVAVAIDLMDLADPDPEAEDNADREASDGDEQDQAWIEWQAMRGSQKRGPMILTGQEDDEDDDPDCGLDEGEPNFVRVSEAGAGCPISDPGGCEHDGREPGADKEREQMAQDVPAFPVYALEPNICNGKLAFLGMNATGFIGNKPAVA